MNIPDQFKAFRIHNDDRGYRAGVEQIGLDDLNEGAVTVRVTYSSINYKDALAGTGEGKILRQFPLVGGIDLAGEVVTSEDENFEPGDEVLVTGSGLSETRDGGYSEYQRLDPKWVIPLPEGLSARDAMGLGTAGFTAALCLYRMEAAGQTPDMGPIVVTGASGGVGSFALAILTKAGYEAHAISGKVEEFDYLQHLGAQQCISRHDLYWGEKPLETARWAGAIDNVGDDMLNGLTRVIKPWGNIASCGLAGGIGLNTTVMPFIIRGISLIGINSSGCPRSIRETIWKRLAGDWKPDSLDDIVHRQVTLEEMPDVFKTMLDGGSVGRTVVKIDE